MPEDRISPNGRTQVDVEIIAILREALTAQGLTQKALSERTGMSQPKISVRLKPYGASLPMHEFILLCAGLGLDPVQTLEVAGDRAKLSQKRSSGPKDANGMTEGEREQVDAVGRQLAHSLWDGANDIDFVCLAIDQLVARDDVKFWTPTKQNLVLKVALRDLARTIGLRQPVRDQFPLKPILEPEDIVR